MKMYSRVKNRLVNSPHRMNEMIQKMRAKINGVVFGDDFRVRGKLQIYNLGKIEVGNNVTINSASWANAIGGGTLPSSKSFQQAC